MTLGRVKVFEVDLSNAIGRSLGRLTQAKGFTIRSQARMAREMREAIERRLENVIQDSYPVRTGKSQRTSRARAFGTTLTNMRGTITGPANIKVLNEGAEINPANGEYLTIPFGFALRPDGTPKLPSARSWQNIKKTFVYKSKKTGQLYIAYKNGDGEDAKVVVLYVLVETASIMPRGFLNKGWARQTPALGREIGNIMMRELANIDLLSMARVTYKGRKAT